MAILFAVRIARNPVFLQMNLAVMLDPGANPGPLSSLVKSRRAAIEARANNDGANVVDGQQVRRRN